MRAGRRSVAVAALGIAPLACAVYDAGTRKGQEPGDAPEASGGSAASGTSGSATSGLGASGSSISGSGASDSGVAQVGGAPSTSGAAGTTAGGNLSIGGSSNPASGGGGGAQIGGETWTESGAAGNGGESEVGGAVASGAAAGMSGASGRGGGAGTAGTSGNGGGAGTAGTSGNAGTAGGPAAPSCNDHPLTPRASWVASASGPDSPSTDTPPHLLDNKSTRWTTGKPQAGDEWLQIDFGATVTLNHINLQQGGDTNDYPRNYNVFVSDTAQDSSGSARLIGSGKSGVSTAMLLPTLATGRFLLIKQTGSSLSWWSAEELEVSCSE